MEDISEENHDLFQLPPDIIEYRDMVQKFVEKEIMPLEPDYLKSPHAGYGLQPLIASSGWRKKPGSFT